MKRRVLIVILILAIIGIAVGVYLIFSEFKDKDVSENTPENQQINADDCLEDIYNCDDFDTQQEAQDMFELCGGVANDIHQLDKDGDGIVCEGLA